MLNYYYNRLWAKPPAPDQRAVLATLRKVRPLAERARMAYITPDRIAHDQYFESWHTGANAFVWLTDKDTAVLAFRGTSEGLDVLADLDVARVPFLGGGQVHRGFHGQFTSLEPHITNFLREKAELKRIHVTGHSLGGALAVLAAAHYADVYEDVECVTFGGPRVGDATFVERIQEKLGDKYVRVTCQQDPVPRIPISNRFHHVGRCFQFDDACNVAVLEGDDGFWTRVAKALFNLDPTNVAGDHMMDVYCQRLDKVI